MAGSDSFIQTPPDSTGKLVDADSLTTGSGTVQRQRHRMAGAAAGELADVRNTQPGSTDFGVVSREANLGQKTMANSQAVTLASDQSAIPVTTQPGTSGGLAGYHAVSAGSTNLATIKATRGMVYGWRIYNNAGYVVFVKLFNKASNPVLGTDVPVLVFGVQAGTPADDMTDVGLDLFSAGIAVAIVKGIADSDATAVLASDCVVDILFK